MSLESNRWINIFRARIKKRSSKIPEIPEKVWQDPLYFIAFGFGVGALPIAPGTFATLLAIPFYLALAQLPLYFYIAAVVLIFAASVFVSDRLSKEINIHDHPGMCIDEFVGFFVTMINAPHGFWWIALGVVLFRIFDIWKPWPISYLDKNVHGGFGMIIDDVVAGLFAFAIIQLLGKIA